MMRSIQLKSCTECRRRKIRCDKTVPCRACNERGEASLCHLAVIQRSHDPGRHRSVGGETEMNDLKRELIDVRHRLAVVEEKLGVSREGQAGTSNAANTETPLREDHLTEIMEDAAFDVGQTLDRQVNSTGHKINWLEALSLEVCLESLPPREHCEDLVALFMEHLNWFCGCLHGPTLHRMHQEFWTQREQNKLEDTMFVALLFAVLSNTAYLMDSAQPLKTDLDPEILRSRAAVWFHCSYSSFFRCNGLAEPCLLGVQTMVTLNYAFHVSGNSRTHGAMFSINIGMARAIKLHLLGKRTAASPNTVDESEIGRRVWWTLVETDWYFTAYKKYAYVAPHSYDTAVPDVTDEGELHSDNPRALTSLSYLLATCESARILFDLFGTLSPYQKPSYSSILLASDRLDKILASFTSLEQCAERSESVSYLYNQRVIEMTLHYRSYLIHRSHFVRSLSDPKFVKSYNACITAAHSILELIDHGLPDGFYRLWNVTIWLIAAGLVLALDLVKASSSGRKLPGLRNVRQRLANLSHFLMVAGDTTGIGSRGAKLIDHLCSMENDIADGTSISLGRMTRQEIVQVATRENLTEDNMDLRNAAMGTNWTSPGFDETYNSSSGDMTFTARALNDLMFLQPSWPDIGASSTAQGFSVDSTSNLRDVNDFLDFFTDIGTASEF